MGRADIRIPADPHMAETWNRAGSLDSIPSLGMGTSRKFPVRLENHRSQGIFHAAVRAAAVLGGEEEGEVASSFPGIGNFSHCGAVLTSLCCSSNTEGILRRGLV